MEAGRTFTTQENAMASFCYTLPSKTSMHALLNFARRKPAGSQVQALQELEDAHLAAVYYDQRRGGDCHDFLRVSPSRVLFILLDVAGRAPDIREIVASTQNVFRSVGTELFAREDANEADAMVNLCLELNRNILKTAGRVCSSPAFAGCYNETLGTVSYFNAGHTPGLLRDKERVIELPATGLPLGLFSHATPDAFMCALEPGDALLLVSRGIVEARRGLKEFGLEQVKEYLRQTMPKTAPEICAGILDEVRNFTRKPRTENDVTVLALARDAAVKTAASGS
jgi:serine phosphatase RsbU (regulator of sigma subunit)